MALSGTHLVELNLLLLSGLTEGPLTAILFNKCLVLVRCSTSTENTENFFLLCSHWDFKAGLAILHLQNHVNCNRLSRSIFSEPLWHNFLCCCINSHRNLCRLVVKEHKAPLGLYGTVCLFDFCLGGTKKKKRKCCHGFGTLAERWKSGLSLWINSVSVRLWCAVTASDNFYKQEEHSNECIYSTQATWSTDEKYLSQLRVIFTCFRL